MIVQKNMDRGCIGTHHRIIDSYITCYGIESDHKVYDCFANLCNIFYILGEVFVSGDEQKLYYII